MTHHDDFRLANDPSTPPSVLERLALSDRVEIRASVAANASSNSSTLLSLVGDSDPEVVSNLMDNPNRFTENLVVSSCKNIVLTLADVSDAEFILSLRQNEGLNRFVSQVSSDLTKQQDWLRNYKKRESVRSEFYFIIRDLEMNPLGTVRVYDFQSGSFCWGSWMVSPESPRKTAIESALCVYEFAFYQLGFKQSHFDVRNKNEKVIKFHKRMGAKEINSDDLDTFFIYKKEYYESVREKYNSFFNNGF